MGNNFALSACERYYPVLKFKNNLSTLFRPHGPLVGPEAGALDAVGVHGHVGPGLHGADLQEDQILVGGPQDSKLHYALVLGQVGDGEGGQVVNLSLQGNQKPAAVSPISTSWSPWWPWWSW